MVAHDLYKPDELEAFCRKWKIEQMWLFGSAVRDDFRPDSDVDVMVRFEPGVSWGLFGLEGIRQELEAFFGREVDLVTRGAIEQSKNWIRRRHILESAKSIYHES